MPSSEFDLMTAIELRRRIARREISPVEVTRRALEKAQATQGSLNAFFLLMPEKAMAAARAAEAAVMRGDALGALHGVPVSVKDLIAVAGERYAFGSRCLADNVAAADAPSVERAKRAGAIVIGKTTTSEFGCKGVGDSPLTGITRNPWNLEKTPGGSSAGAAASVAAGITAIALGTDGGGSLRIPGCSHRARRHQGTVRPHRRVASVGDHHARACRADGAHGRGRGAAVHGVRRAMTRAILIRWQARCPTCSRPANRT